MIIMVSFSDSECALFGKSAAALRTEPVIRCIEGIGSVDETVLTEVSEQARITYPQVIVLNLDVKRQSWHQNLSLLKNNSFWRRIPVVGVGLLEEKEDIEGFYALGGASCIRKPGSYAGLMGAVTTAMRYWQLVEVLPDQFLESA